MLELADAVIIGGGVLGLALARELAGRLSRVLVVEANRCGSGATAGGFAWLNASSKWQDPQYHGLNADGLRMYREMAAEFGPERTGWNGGGTLFWARLSDTDVTAALTRQCDALQATEYPIFRLNCGDMRALEPNIQFDDDAAGIFAPSEGWVDTRLLGRLLMEQARARHAVIAEYTRVIGFSLDHRGAVSSVETTAGRVSTRLAVICAGVEAPAIVSLIHGDRPPRLMVHSPGLLVETGPVDQGARVHRVCYPASGNGFHFRPTAEGGLLLGADDTDLLAAGSEQAHDPTAPGWTGGVGTAELIERTAAVLPGFDRRVQVMPRVCHRPLPADGLPIVGELRGVGGAYLLASHSGVTLGPLLARLLADEIVSGRASPTLAPYRPSRFRA